MPDPNHANDHSRTTTSKMRMDSRVRDPTVVVVVVDERGAEIHREARLSKKVTALL